MLMLFLVEAATSHLTTSRKYRGLIEAETSTAASDQVRKRIEKLEPELDTPWPLIDVAPVGEFICTLEEA